MRNCRNLLVGLLSCVVGLVGVLRVGRADNGGSGSILPGDGYPTTRMPEYRRALCGQSVYLE